MSLQIMCPSSSIMMGIEELWKMFGVEKPFRFPSGGGARVRAFPLSGRIEHSQSRGDNGVVSRYQHG